MSVNIPPPRFPPQDLVLGALAPTLSLAGIRRLAVSVDDDDAAAKLLWAGYGFTPLQVRSVGGRGCRGGVWCES